MILLDTDTFSHLTRGHEKVVARLATVTDDAAITIVTRVEALEGRLAFLKRAANGEELLRAQGWLQRTELELAQLPIVLFDEAAAAEFDRLRGKQKAQENRPGRPAHRRHLPGEPCYPDQPQPQGLPSGARPAIRELVGLTTRCDVDAIWGAFRVLRQTLLAIPIPLKAPDQDVIIDLQKVFQQTYQRGCYGRSLRYGQSPHVSLVEKDRRWVMAQRPK
jgi:predicted nucleic acid-binding protein